MIATLIGATLCNALALAVLVYALSAARCTTNSYQLDLIAFAVLFPSMFSALLEAGYSHFASGSASLVAIIGIRCGIYWVYGRAYDRRAAPVTLMVISFAVFQATMACFSIFMSDKSFAFSSDSLPTLLVPESTIRRNFLWVPLIGITTIALLAATAKYTSLVATLKAHRDNPELLLQFDERSTSRIVWIGTLMATILTCVSGLMLLLTHESVHSADAYPLLLLAFGVLLIVEGLDLIEVVTASIIVALTYQFTSVILGVGVRPIVAAMLLMVACVGRRYVAARR